MELQSAAEDIAFVQSLAELKRTGCNLLVVGRTAPNVHTIGCDRLLGRDERSPRWRVLVRTDGSCQRDTDACAAGAPDRTRTIPFRPHVRSAAAHSALSSDAPGPSPGSHLDFPHRGSVAAIPLAVDAAIDEFESAGGPFEPAALRLCVDSLAPLLEEYELDVVFRLLHLLTTRIDVVDGMGHYHLPLPIDHEIVRTVEPLFDAIIELRTSECQLEQRWHLYERGVTSEWLPLERE